MLHVKLRASRQDLSKFFERVGQKIRFAMVMACKRMSSLDDPVDVVRNMRKEFASVAGLESLKNIPDMC